MKLREKALRLPEEHTRRIMFEGVCKSRFKRRDVKSEADNLCKELGEYHHGPFDSLLNHGKKV